MADRRYRTARWRRTRAYVIARDRQCMLNGPRCNGRAETAHHTEPSSRSPELFFDVRFIVAACKPCNYSDGAYVGAENRRMHVAQLEEIIVRQHAEIVELTERLAAFENGAPERHRTPRIY